jgi:hypothetical protein
LKTFKDYISEEAMTTNSGIAGLGTGEVADWKKPKRKKPLTRHYIEVDGKIKKQAK